MAIQQIKRSDASRVSAYQELVPGSRGVGLEGKGPGGEDGAGVVRRMRRGK